MKQSAKALDDGFPSYAEKVHVAFITRMVTDLVSWKP